MDILEFIDENHFKNEYTIKFNSTWNTLSKILLVSPDFKFEQQDPALISTLLTIDEAKEISNIDGVLNINLK